MDKQYSVKQMALVALVVAVAAVLIFWVFSRGGPDRLDRQIEALNARVSAAESMRDSLIQVINVKEDSLIMLAAQEVNLQNQVAELGTAIDNRRDNLITVRSRPTHVELQPDELLLELNAIIRSLPDDDAPSPGSGPGAP